MDEPIKRINSYTLQRIRKAVADALSEVSDDFNVRFVIENGRYARDGSYGEVNMKVFVEDAMTALQPDGQLMWDKDCYRYGLKSSDYGREIMLSNGERYKLTGIKTKNKKYPIIATKLTGFKKGGSFKLPFKAVNDALS